MPQLQECMRVRHNDGPVVRTLLPQKSALGLDLRRLAWQTAGLGLPSRQMPAEEEESQEASEKGPPICPPTRGERAQYAYAPDRRETVAIHVNPGHQFPEQHAK